MSRFKLLLIGPLPPPLGGATVLFELLTEELKRCDSCEVKVINSNINKSSPVELFKLLYNIYKYALAADIVNLHASYRGITVLGPYVFFIARLLRKKLIFRLFGGDFFERYRASSIVSAFMFNKILFKADLVLFETQALVRQFNSHGNLKWFPNHRKPDNGTVILKETQMPLRVIYVSHIRKEKGIFELIEASNRLKGVSIDIFGPFFDGLTAKIFEDAPVRYLGVLEQNKVKEELKKYDIMILPSYKEGYPGVIIEAFVSGVAVICTNLETLKEMVTQHEDAILIEPRSSEDIVKAIRLLDQDRKLLNKLKINSKKKSELYDSGYWVEKFISYCDEVLKGCS